MSVIPPQESDHREETRSDDECDFLASSTDVTMARNVAGRQPDVHNDLPLGEENYAGEASGDADERSVVRWANQRLDYQYRGAHLEDWPLYFYIA